MLGEKQKLAIERVIALNPTKVRITRVEYLAENGARRKMSSSRPEQQWLVFPNKQQPQQKSDEAGLEQADSWAALAPSYADVAWGSNVSDTFEVEHVGTLLVTGGEPISIGNVLSGYRLQLEIVR